MKGISVSFAMYCLCGASWKGSDIPVAKTEYILRVWNEEHSGNGHGKATRKQAVAARRRADIALKQNISREARGG